MKNNHHDLKSSIDLPNGVTLGYTLTGDIVAIDQTGKRLPLDDADAVKWFYFSVTNSFPATPTLPPMSPETAATIAKAREREAAKTTRGQGLTGRINADGAMVITLEDGTTVTLPSA